MIKVAINGFGRIGRNVLKAGLKNKNIEFVAVNDLTDPKSLAHLFKYDSVFGKFDGKVSSDGKDLMINGKKVSVFAERDPENLPWGKLNVDIVVESTGFFRKYDGAYKHIKAGAKKVIISAPAKGDKPIDLTVVLGVNDSQIKKDFKILSNDRISPGHYYNNRSPGR